ncbi:MAG: hypothetical protein GC160_12120 [Acidobacteria bacterium]|nr:hypothetical protein [Acidobacteriota bacterium]
MSADRIVGLVFAAFAAALMAGAKALPAGIGKQPGAGFFPFWIGVAMLLLAAPLILKTSPEKAKEPIRWSRPALVAGLTLVYLLLWGSGWFALRTVVFLALLLRLLGESWRAGLGVSATLTAAVVLAFQYGLRVSLE